jgi:hypothetical protein
MVTEMDERMSWHDSPCLYSKATLLYPLKLNVSGDIDESSGLLSHVVRNGTRFIAFCEYR